MVNLPRNCRVTHTGGHGEVEFINCSNMERVRHSINKIFVNTLKDICQHIDFRLTKFFFVFIQTFPGQNKDMTQTGPTF